MRPALMFDVLLSEDELIEVDLLDIQAVGISDIWKPNPDKNDKFNPQKIAFDSLADELFYGGAAGGGKTDLGIGLALTKHRRSVIFRRVAPNLDAIEQRIFQLAGEDNYNKSRRVYNDGDHRVELQSCQYEDDKKKQQGRSRDFYFFDEPTEFTQSQYIFIIGWNRSVDSDQRCRVVLAGNPPIDSDGEWIIEAFAPWLDSEFPNPAEPGELRWYYYDDSGFIQWIDTPKEIDVSGQMIRPKSRTFIPAKLQDNPHYGGDYLSRLNSLPEPLRSAFRDGNFKAIKTIDPFQIIRVGWVRAAQRRWLESKRPNGRPDGAGHDVSRGGRDATCYGERYGDYFDKIHKWPGIMVPDGQTAAGLIHGVANDPEVINTDVIGYGSSSHDFLRDFGYNSNPVNVGSGSDYTDKSGKLKMLNLRAELTWRMRDALDPNSNSTVMLPPGNDIVADLCCFRYRLVAGGKVRVENKEDIKKRLGRSPDVGDTLLLMNYRPERFVVGQSSYV